MTQPSDAPDDTSTSDAPEGVREPTASPQRRLVETISAYEVDPPAPARVREAPTDT